MIVAALAPAMAFTQHAAVTVRGTAVEFYAGHLVLDASGNASLDDGVVHVTADRIIVDLTNDRFLAAGNVVMTGVSSPAVVGSGAALGVDLSTHKGSLIALDPAPASFTVTGASIIPTPSASPSASDDAEPLKLVDLQGELPFARAGVATAHLGADVRLAGARVLVPGGKDVFVPSYVYTFSSDAGYSASNVSGSGEDLPILFGSTRDSVSAAHFTYDPVTKVGVGIDHRIVDGRKAYDLFSVSPLNGPSKNATFTWQEQINGHTSQTLNGATSSLIGSRWLYDVNDSVHRSFFDLSSSTGLGGNFSTLAWQGAYEPIGPGVIGRTLEYRLRSEFGRSQSYVGGIPTVYDKSLDLLIAAPSLALDPSSSLSLQSEWRDEADNEPHREFAADYSATLTHQWNRLVTTSLTDAEIPVVDYFPSFGAGTRSYESQQNGTLSYNHGDALAFTLGVTHTAFASTPFPFSVQPWSASLDVRFRINPSLSLELSRGYGFGFNGQRFGSLGFQILP